MDNLVGMSVVFAEGVIVYLHHFRIPLLDVDEYSVEIQSRHRQRRKTFAKTDFETWEAAYEYFQSQVKHYTKEEQA